MDTLKDKLYTVRWEIKHGNIDDALKIISELLGEAADPQPPEERPNPDAVGKRMLWYPHATISPTKMPVQGTYKDRYPVGAVVHFTAGRSLQGDKNAQNTIEYGARQGYAYFCISNTGTIIQAHPLDKYGSHAGVSNYPGLGTSLSSKLVGIEICCAGRVQKLPDGRFKPKDFDDYFTADQVRESPKKENIKTGIYHRYTEAQEKALVELLVWLKRNNPDVFNFDYVLGHDEIAPTRKDDPGASLSMTMPKFRALLKDRYNNKEG